MALQAAVLWTGGKDCTLALCRARDAGVAIRALATFHPEGNSVDAFKAHPLPRVREIAAAANLPLELVPVAAPYRAGYIRGLEQLRDKYGIDAVVTGDIDLVDGLPNWIRQCCESVGIQAIMPLWQQPREELLRELLARGIAARVSWINSPHLPGEWLGRTIDARFIDDIVLLAETVSIDVCGENGEYHTTVERIP